MNGRTTIRPSRRAVLATLLVTSVIWVPGLLGLFLDSHDTFAWLTVLGASLIIGYVLTQKIVVEEGKVRAFRYFMLQGEADAHSARLINAKIGTPPILAGLAVIADGHTVVEMAPWNFARRDIDKLRASLSPSA